MSDIGRIQGPNFQAYTPKTDMVKPDGVMEPGPSPWEGSDRVQVSWFDGRTGQTIEPPRLEAPARPPISHEKALVLEGRERLIIGSCNMQPLLAEDAPVLAPQARPLNYLEVFNVQPVGTRDVSAFKDLGLVGPGSMPADTNAWYLGA